MINLYLFLSLVFIFTFIVGKWIEKVKVPWLFASLILGAILSLDKHIVNVSSSNLKFLADMGMYLLIFMIGFELDVKEILSLRGFIIKTTAFVILLEGLINSFFIHYIFHLSWLLSFIVALSFATVGEAILIPILEEFKLVKTKLGEAIIGIGTFDDIVEIVAIIIVSFIVGKDGKIVEAHTFSIILSLLTLFVLTFAFIKFKDKTTKFGIVSIESLFLLILFVFFLFIGIGAYGDAGVLGALLAGIAIKSLVPKDKIALVESEIKTMTYGFFAPLFFIWVGMNVNLSYLFNSPFIILLFVVFTALAKMMGSILASKKLIGLKQSILLGLGLCVRFSTSMVIISLLYESGIVNNELYSIVIASSIIFNFIVPFLFSYLLNKWNIGKK